MSGLTSYCKATVINTVGYKHKNQQNQRISTDSSEVCGHLSGHLIFANTTQAFQQGKKRLFKNTVRKIKYPIKKIISPTLTPYNIQKLTSISIINLSIKAKTMKFLKETTEFFFLLKRIANFRIQKTVLMTRF